MICPTQIIRLCRNRPRTWWMSSKKRGQKWFCTCLARHLPLSRDLRSSCRRGNNARHPPPSPRVKVKHDGRPAAGCAHLCASASIGQPPDGFIRARLRALHGKRPLSPPRALQPQFTATIASIGYKNPFDFFCRHVADLIISTIIFIIWHS